MVKIIKNKKAWIRIVESFVAVLLIAAVLLTVINQDIPVKKDNSETMYTTAGGVLKTVLLNDNLRKEILTEDIEWSDTKVEIQKITPDYLRCVPAICLLVNKDACTLEVSGSISPGEDVEVYTKSAIIIAEKKEYNPKIIKLFCWLKAESI